MWVQPISLGWHFKQADLTAWYAIYMPTGRYTPGGDGNRGLGMWSHELSIGTTAYFNEARTYHAALTAAFEFHSKKEDSDTKVGNVVTLEGGLGTTLKKALDVGVAYYFQQKLTRDTGLGVPLLVENRLGKNRSAGVGPQVSLVLPLSKDFSKLLIFDFKYLWEKAVRLDTKGNVLVFSATWKVF